MYRLTFPLIGLLLAPLPVLGQQPRPNVILIITDDQGLGDLGFHGNPVIKTPHLDRLARQSVRLKYFYVTPVCSPTRAGLLTGRYNYRTGVVNTFRGRSMMHPDEVTLAELLAAAGYRTGIFGKWHLGDCFPLRAIDQGFHEALVCTGGGLTQPSDPPGNSYFDPILFRNGKAVKSKGYCTDVFTEAALGFITHNRDRPFFCYIPYNAPHSPLQVPEKYVEPYRQLKLTPALFPKIGQPLPAKLPQDEIARVYAMVQNIDDNVGRLLAKLEELKIADNTIVIFLTDNGPQGLRYVAGLLGRKGTVHEGGTRVPFFLRWPGQLPGDRDIDRIAAHIDVLPTLLEACRVSRPAKLKLDGRSLMPLLRGQEVEWPNRTLFMQWHRGDVPELYRACAARDQRWRLVQPEGVQEGIPLKKITFQLYDIQNDPYQLKNVAEQHPEVVARLKKEYENWFKDVSSTRGYDPPRIFLGAEQQNPVTLTRQDWRGPRATWSPEGLGHWEVQVARAGRYEITLRFAAVKRDTTAHLRLAGTSAQAAVKAGQTEIRFPIVDLPAGPTRLEAMLDEGASAIGVNYVDVERK